MQFKRRRGRNRLERRTKRRGRLQYKKGRRFSSSLKAGIKVEMEHQNTLKKLLKTNSYKRIKYGASLIAKDHLKENKRYYYKLKKCKL